MSLCCINTDIALPRNGQQAAVDAHIFLTYHFPPRQVLKFVLFFLLEVRVKKQNKTKKPLRLIFLRKKQNKTKQGFLCKMRFVVCLVESINKYLYQSFYGVW